MLTKQLREMERQAEVIRRMHSHAPYFYVHNEKVDHIVKTVGESKVEVKDCDEDGKMIHLKSVDPVTLHRLFVAGYEWGKKIYGGERYMSNW